MGLTLQAAETNTINKRALESILGVPEEENFIDTLLGKLRLNGPDNNHSLQKAKSFTAISLTEVDHQDKIHAAKNKVFDENSKAYYPD